MSEASACFELTGDKGRGQLEDAEIPFFPLVAKLDNIRKRAHAFIVLVEPLKTREAERLVRKITNEGEVLFTHHAHLEMAKDTLDPPDVHAVLRGGVVEPAEFENGTWRHRVRTARICAVITFKSTTRLMVVTAWRIKK